MSDRIAEIRARLEAATPGPWNITNGIFFGNWPVGTLVTGRDGESDKDYIVNIVSDADIYPPSTARTDAELIVHAPDDIAYLLAALDENRETYARTEADNYATMMQLTAEVERREKQIDDLFQIISFYGNPDMWKRARAALGGEG